MKSKPLQAQECIEKAQLNEKISLAEVDDYWAEVVFKYTGELGYTYFARAQNQKEGVYPKKRAYWCSIKFYPSLEVAKRKFIARLKSRKVL